MENKDLLDRELEREKEQEAKVGEQPEQTEHDKLIEETELLELKARLEEANTHLKVAKAGYDKVSDLLAREAGIIDKETELETTARELGAINAKNAEILAKIADAKAQVATERQGLKADIKSKQDFELFYKASGSKWKNEQVEKELHWLFVKFAGQVYGYKRDDEAWQHVRRLEKLWLGLEKEVR